MVPVTEEEKVRLAAQEMSDKAVSYNVGLVKDLARNEMISGKIEESEQTGRMLYQSIMGLLIYGRVHRSLDVVKQDLKTAIYRIIELKNEYCVALYRPLHNEVIY